MQIVVLNLQTCAHNSEHYQLSYGALLFRTVGLLHIPQKCEGVCEGGCEGGSTAPSLFNLT